MRVDRYSVRPLDLELDRSGFSCGEESLDRYFKVQIGQDIKRRIAAGFAAIDVGGRVAGYYTLASASILLTELPKELARKLPRYPQVPAVRMGRLAVDRRDKGKGLGAALLANALRRALSAEIAAYALVVDAKDEHAAAFYAHHGFLATTGNPLFLYLPLATAREALSQR